MRLYERFADKGYHSSIATTFGIDFDAYENIVLPRIRGAGCRNNMVLADARMLTHALGGASPLPRQAGRLYTASGAQVAGLFHPKLFLQIGRQGGRLFIGSANLTAAGLAGNLELVTLLTSGVEDDGAQRLIAQAYRYLSSLIDPADPMLPTQFEWMLARAAWLRSAAPAKGPVELGDGTRAALLLSNSAEGIGARFAREIDGEVKRLIVISPYWDERLGALSALAERLRPRAIAALIDTDTGLFPRDATGSISGITLYRRDGFGGSRFIHAKALIAQTDTADHLLIGSANCTVAALGTGNTSGSNSEASLYRQLPPDRAVSELGLEKVLTPERRIEVEELPPLHVEDDIPFDALSQSHPGIFAVHGDTLSWRPAAHVGAHEAYEVELLAASGAPLVSNPTRLEGADHRRIRFQIEAADDLPAFARLIGPQEFTPGIITHIDALQIAIRETHSRQTENALAQLDGETEATLALLEVQDLLEKIEDRDADGHGEGVSIPKARKETDEGGQKHRQLSYDDFIAGRRPHQSGQVQHNSLGGSDVSIVRGFLNRIVGLNSLVTPVDENDEDALKDAFDLGDEIQNAEVAMAAGEEFAAKPTSRPVQDGGEEEQRRNARRANATKDQLVKAAADFAKRIELKQESGSLSSRDFLRLRALLMVICAASSRGTDKAGEKPKDRTSLQVLPVEGDTNSWPYVLGRLIFKVFGGSKPAIRSLKLDSVHDQLPADLLECWATCFWCMHACLCARLSPGECTKIQRHILPLMEQVYRRTHLSKDELLAALITDVMDGMSIRYADRLGINPEALSRAHRSACERIFS